MAAFTNQFSRRDPRSETPAISPLFDGAIEDAFYDALSLVRDTPVSELEAICQRLSKELDPNLFDWDALMFVDLGKFAPVRLSIVYGAFALWKLCDLRDLLERFSVRGHPVSDPWQLGVQHLYHVANEMLTIERVCMHGYDLHEHEAIKAAASARGRHRVQKRHERTTAVHKKAAILAAAKMHASGRYSSAMEVARRLSMDLMKNDKDFYTEKVIRGWLSEAGWGEGTSWPNRPSLDDEDAET